MTSKSFPIDRLVQSLKGLVPAPPRRAARWALDRFGDACEFVREQWYKRTFLPRLRRQHPADYEALLHGDMPERLRATIIDRLATEAWREWPAQSSTPSVSADVVFVSHTAHPDLLKQCIALKREMPGLRCALVVENHAHTQRLCRQWFDEVIVFGTRDESLLLKYLRNADAKVVIFRYRGVLLDTLARVFRRGPLIYSPPGFYLSSRSNEYNNLADPHMTFAEVLEADKFLLERADGILHFLSDGAFDWFRERGVDLRCPTATVYVACLPELEPRAILPKLSDADGEWHIVHATGVPEITPFWTPEMGRDAILSLAKCEQVVNQGIHLHVYATHFSRWAPGYAPYVELERRSRYFHIEQQLEFDDLLAAMTQYDYAWKHWDYTGIAIWPIFYQHLTPNFLAYIQSGLPFLMSPAAVPLEVEMARKHGIGLFVPEGELSRAKEFLDGNKEDLPAMRRRVAEAKKTVFSYDAKSLLKVVGPYLK